MALSNYTELQTAIQSELDRTETNFVTAIPDLILRCEVRLNRKLRLREMEQLAYATYSVGTTALADRLLALPDGYIEMLQPLRAKQAAEADTNYVPLLYCDPQQISDYYGTSATKNLLRYTLRDEIEFSAPVGSEHTIMMHYLKKWNIASDSTNWLLTNYPDVYLFGSLMQSELFIMNDPRAATWKTLYDEGIAELNLLSDRGRDDAELDVSELANMSSTGGYNILTG
jgi:hypothetical protein